MATGEFTHIHPSRDGSLHLILSEQQAAEVITAGWGELHPVDANKPGPGRLLLMVYGARDEQELEVILEIVKATYDYITASTQ